MPELGLAELMAAARIKLMAALPAGARAARVASRFHLDATGWFRATAVSCLAPQKAYTDPKYPFDERNASDDAD
jgi:hypothetical protein